MTVEQVEAAILALSADDRRRIALWFEEPSRELLDDEADEELTEQQKAEILRRRDLALAHPELLEPWDGTIERVRERLNELRRHMA
jgi:hypothetical protein